MKHLEPRRRLLIAEAQQLQYGSHDLADRPSFTQMESDLLKKDPSPVTIFSLLMTSFTMVSYAMDVSSSGVLCYWLFNIHHWWWWMTFGPLLVSLVIVNVFSMRWYIHDAQEKKTHLPRVSIGHWIMRIMFHVVLLGPLIRYAELFLYGVHTMDSKDPEQHRYRLMFLQESSDVSLLTLVGSFVKSAPQLVLHMFILTQSQVSVSISITQAEAVNLASSIFQLSLAQMAYHRALRRSNPLKKDMSRMGSALQFFSHFCVLTSRVIVLAVFATVYKAWIFVFCAIHWGVMTIWLVTQKTSVCASASGHPRPFEELGFNVVVGLIYVFCFVNVKAEPTRWKYATYYFLTWVENLALVVLWYIQADPTQWFKIHVLCSVVISLALGLIVLAIYYRFFHPNNMRNELTN